MFRDRLGEIGWRIPGRRVLAIAGSVLLVLALLVLGGLYERKHLSADLRRTLLVAVAPDTPGPILTGSLRQARGHLHTWRDHQEYDKLQRAVEATVAAQRSEARLGGRLKQAQTELDAEIHSERLMIVTERAYLDSHQSMPPGLADDVAREQLRREQVRDQQQRDDEGAWLQLLQQRLDARVLMRELRVDLGLAVPAAQP